MKKEGMSSKDLPVRNAVNRNPLWLGSHDYAILKEDVT
jgi:hypothetical protein